MKKISGLFLLTSIIILSAFTITHFIDWKIVEGYSIKFSDGGSNSGMFKNMSGSISFDENNPESAKISVTVEVASISTGNTIKNNHAKGEKWFHADKYPSMKFNSGTVVKKGATYEVTGILEMHGVQKQITIPFSFINNVFTGSFSVNRIDYNIGPTGGNGDIKIDISVPVSKA